VEDEEELAEDSVHLRIINNREHCNVNGLVRRAPGMQEQLAMHESHEIDARARVSWIELVTVSHRARLVLAPRLGSKANLLDNGQSIDAYLSRFLALSEWTLNQ
jgi:hypothetical protein